MWSQTVDQLGHGLGARGGRKNDPCTAQLLQCLRRIRCFAVDVDARTQLLRQRAAFGPESNGRHVIAELARELNAEVAQPADSLHGNKVTRTRAATAQRIEGGDAGAKQWSCLDIGEGFRYPHQGLGRSEHVLFVSAVVANPGNPAISAVAEVSPPALPAGAIVSAMPADADALPLGPSGNSGTHSVDETHHFMTWYARVLDTGPGTFLCERVTMTDAAGLHLDSHLSRCWVRNFPLDDLELCSRAGNLCRLHRCHRCCCAHNSSAASKMLRPFPVVGRCAADADRASNDRKRQPIDRRRGRLGWYRSGTVLSRCVTRR